MQRLHVAVGVITYRRPDGLARLLQSLGDLDRSKSADVGLSVIVVDNDAEQSGRAAAALPGAPFPIRYEVEPRQGIPIARNKILDCLPSGADFLCFLDDDEWVSPQWLDELVCTQRRTGASCVYGPVEPVYEGSPPPWVERSRIFERKQHPDGAELRQAATNNVMISTDFIHAHRLRFSEQMRFTGGSDFLFFRQGVQRGLRIVWAAGASVYDVVPKARMNWRWVAQRQYRLGNTFAVAERIDGAPGARARLLLVGILRMGLGVALIPTAVFGPKFSFMCLRHLLRGWGITAGLFGVDHLEYAPEALARERRG